MLVALAVVFHRAFLREFRGGFEGNVLFIAARGRETAELNGVHRLAHIAPARAGDILNHALVDYIFFFSFFAQKVKSPQNGALDFFGGHAFELKDG